MQIKNSPPKKETPMEKLRTKLESRLEYEKAEIGKKEFKELAGHFCGFIQTRPYMQTRAHLASVLWILGEHDSAIKHYENMIKLNPSDNQGIRYLLVNRYLELNQLDSCKKLIQKFKDDGRSQWAFTLAFLTFKLEGASQKANKILKAAFQRNPYVADYILGTKKLPKSLPDYYGFGDQSEAIVYVSESLNVWRKNPDALLWLKNLNE